MKLRSIDRNNQTATFSRNQESTSPTFTLTLAEIVTRAEQNIVGLRFGISTSRLMTLPAREDPLAPLADLWRVIDFLQEAQPEIEACREAIHRLTNPRYLSPPL